MSTLLLTRSQVESLLNPPELLAALREGFISYSQGRGERAQRARSALPGPGTATVLFPGMSPAMPAYTVKVHAKFPAQVPAIRGVLCLHAAATGQLLAIMDATHLTAVRTGLSGALAAHVLARADASSVAVIGCGVQGRHQLASLAALRPLTRVRAYDLAFPVAERFSQEMGERLGIPVEPVRSIIQAVADAHLVLMATWAKAPLLTPGMLAPGTHVTALGADEPGKVELSEGVIRCSLFFCDDRKFAAEMGALAAVGLTQEFVAAELGEVLAGAHPGRTAQEQITVYGGVGLAFQDAVCAWSAYQRAIRQSIGTVIDFLA
jgi:ornithine cyclodeaminase/alanine dehydrogenase-like protein (mu-crystallin family)